MKTDRTIETILLLGGAGFLAYKYVWPQLAPRIGVMLDPPTGTVSTAPSTSSGSGAVLANTKWPLGIRNNNPGNIKYNSANKWVGQLGINQGFSTFSSPEYGLRAMFALIKTYITRHGLDTIRKFAARWAPASENNVSAWASNVALMSGIGQDAKLNPANATQMMALAKGIIGAENGSAFVNHYSPSVLSKAWSL